MITFDKLTTALHLLGEKGARRLVNRVLYNLLPPLVFNTISLVLKENAIPVQTGRGNWNIITLPEGIVDRRMPAITTANFVPHGSPAHAELLEQIYEYDGFVTVEQTDTVVEVGSYIGTWTRMAAKTADQVLAIDPLAAFDDSLQFNTRDIDNITIINKAAWHESDTLEINLSQQPNENSVLSPDAMGTGGTAEVSAEPVPTLARDAGFDTIDYLKIEAEGVEPEILESALADGMKIGKIAVDGSSERDGEYIFDEITEILDTYGYKWRIKDEEVAWGHNIIFATKNG
jgi:FkbM family methyltransferase